MDIDDTTRGNEDQRPDLPDPARRWRTLASDRYRQRLRPLAWLRFAAAVSERHLAMSQRLHPGRRDAPRATAVSAEESGPQRDEFLPEARKLSPAGPTEAFGRTVPGTGIGAHRAFGPFTRRGLTGPEGERPATRVSRGDGASSEWPGVSGSGDGFELRALSGMEGKLAPHIQRYLESLLHLRIPCVKIHTDQSADSVARRYDAEAVTQGASIYFRSGRYDPESVSGLALLGHELTHVAHSGLGESEARHAPAALAREESLAVENEKRIAEHARSPARWAPIPVPQTRSEASKGVASVPRTASVDRAASAPQEQEPPFTTAELSEHQLDALKEELYRDLRARVESDFQRGG